MEEALVDIFGLETDFYTILKFCIRAFVVFFVALVFVRLSGKRIFQKTSAFDVVIAIMLGSVMSRAITDSAPFIPTLLSAIVLVGTHRLLAYLAYNSDKFGNLIKGLSTTLIRDGELQEDQMRKANITKQDLLSAVRSKAQLNELDQVKEARLERDGEISIIPKEK